MDTSAYDVDDVEKLVYELIDYFFYWKLEESFVLQVNLFAIAEEMIDRGIDSLSDMSFDELDMLLEKWDRDIDFRNYHPLGPC